MKNLGLLLIFLFINQFGFAQSAILKGKVIDEESEELLLYASVALYQGGKLIAGGQTDLEGNYQINSLEKGIYNLRVTHPIYKTKEIENIRLSRNKVFIVNVSLEKSIAKATIWDGGKKPLDAPLVSSIQGKITSEESGELLLYATVALYQGDSLIVKTQTDFDGDYRLRNLKEGVYELEVSYAGYKTKRIKGIILKEWDIMIRNIELPVAGIIGYPIGGYHSGYRIPLINLSNPFSGKTYTAEEIDKLPIKN